MKRNELWSLIQVAPAAWSLNIEAQTTTVAIDGKPKQGFITWRAVAGANDQNYSRQQKIVIQNSKAIKEARSGSMRH